MKAIRKLTSFAVPAGLARQLVQSCLQPTKGKGVSTVNTPATIHSTVRILCVVIGIGAGAVHEAHADSAAAAIGTSIPLSDQRCFDVRFGAVTNNGNCGLGTKQWEIQLPVRGQGWHGIDLRTSFSALESCKSFVTNQFSAFIPPFGNQSVVPEGASFHRHFDNMWIDHNFTMNVTCDVPAFGWIQTVAWFGV